MLANLLAVVVGLGSLGFYLAAFILPEVHRRSDFFWSGIGMFYAVVLWYCAQQMQGAVLLGQTASVGLLLWLGYQTLLLRRATTPAAQQTPIRLGKSERSRSNGSLNRPIAKDYEFVEDGVEDTVDQEPDPNSPILIQPTAAEFAPKMVVPAAIPKPDIEPDVNPTPQDSAETETKIEPGVAKAKQKRTKPNPLAAIGIVTGWLKDVITPQPKEPQPMVELPPRPPSIPKPAELDQPTQTTKTAHTPTHQDQENSPAEIPDTIATTSPPATTHPPAPQTASAPQTDASPAPSSTPPSQDDAEEEDSNWPDDNFWE